MAKYKSKREKLEAQNYSELVEMPPNWIKRYPVGKLYIPSGKEVESAIREIPYGKLRTNSDIREYLASQHGGATSCAMVFGILWRVVSEAAEEDRQEGRGEPAPYWRVVRDDCSLNEKLPGGIENHAALLRLEGHRVEASGRSTKLRVLVS